MSTNPTPIQEVLATVSGEYEGDTGIPVAELRWYLLCCYFLDAQPHCTFEGERSRMRQFRAAYERSHRDKAVYVGLQLTLELS